VIDNNEATEPKMMANELNSSFTGIADSVLKDAYPNRNLYSYTLAMVAPNKLPAESTFTFKSATNTEVNKALNTLKTAKATGADDIPAKAIKLAADSIPRA